MNQKDDQLAVHLEDLRHRRLRRLRELEKAEALQGYSTPVEIRLEIQDIREKIDDLEQQIMRLRSKAVLEPRPIDNTTGNHLGYGIRLGGVYNGISLGLVASPWASFRTTQVKSGWLYIEGETPSLAAVFFKMHLRADQGGYIHILCAANPPHRVWFETSQTARMEQAFSWDNTPSAPRALLWQFQWAAGAYG